MAVASAQARAATDAERKKYLHFFESDLANLERSYGARVAGEPVSMSISDTVNGTVIALGAALVTARIYARHVELAADGALLRAATTTFSVSGDMKNLQLYSMGPDARSAVASRAQFEATAPAAAKACTPPKKSCRTCSDLNALGVLACCGACAWAGGNPYALLSCAIIMCSICASQNCRRWTYACCQY